MIVKDLILFVLFIFTSMIHVYYYNTGLFDSRRFNEYLALLPGAFQHDILKYKFEKDRVNRLVTRLLLRKAIINTGKNVELLDHFVRDPQNKPFIENWLSFNMSYSNRYVVLAFSTIANIGIDIEQVSDMDIDSVIPWFCAEEIDFIKSSPDPQQSFYTTWVKKEAILKATGKGITGGLNKVNCLNSSVWHNNTWWYWQHLPVAEGYTCYACLPQPAAELKITDITPGTLT